MVVFRQEARQLKGKDVSHQESRSAAVAGAKLSADGFSTQKIAMEQNQQRQTRAAGVVNQEQSSKKSTHSKFTINNKTVSAHRRETTWGHGVTQREGRTRGVRGR